jgi:hypothetical protein
LHVSQSTISKDLEIIRKQYSRGIGERGALNLQEYTDFSLAFDELIRSLWKIIDDTRTSPKSKLKAHSMMKEAQLLAQRLRLNKNNDQVNESLPEGLKSEQKDEIRTQKWTKRSLEKRLKYHTQIDFMAIHFEMMDQIKDAQAILFRTLLDESSKAAVKNLIAMCKISSAISQNVHTLRVLILDTPYMASMKREIDKAREFERRYGKKIQVNKPFDRDDYRESALDIDPNSIAGKPQETIPEEREADRPVF